MWWRRAAKRGWMIALTLLVLLFYVSSATIVTRYFLGSLEWSYPQEEATPDHGDAIVVLGSGCYYYGDDPRPFFTMDEAAMKRTLHAARIYHEVGGCPILVTGRYGQDRSEAGPQPPDDRIRSNPMGNFLLELGVRRDDITIEDQSRDTYENAVYAKGWIEEKGFKDVILVTDAAHMDRAVLCFEKLGVEVTPAACNYQVEAIEFSSRTLLPSVTGMKQAHYAMREYLGLFWYWIQGRI